MFFFLAYFTPYNRLQFHPSHQNWFKCILFNGWVILHCLYVPQLSYPFICWWTSRLLPCPGYYKQCCGEHWNICVSFNSGFLGVYAQQWDCWVIWQFYFHWCFFLEFSCFFFFYYKCIYFNWRLITLQYCISFAIHQHESATGVLSSPSSTPSHLPPHPIPLGHPSAPAPSIQYLHRTWTGDSFLIWYYTYFNAILPNHPILFSPTESKRLFL